MGESYDATLTLWPASSLPASVADELRQAGIDVGQLNMKDGSATLYRTSEGEVALELSCEDSYYGITGLEPVLAQLRLAKISCYAWDEGYHECHPMGRSFDPRSGVETEFVVLPDGAPVLMRADLDPLERFGSADALLERLRERVRRPTPAFTDTVKAAEFTVAIRNDAEVAAADGGDRS
jgi:hypothetical protein